MHRLAQSMILNCSSAFTNIRYPQPLAREGESNPCTLKPDPTQSYCCPLGLDRGRRRISLSSLGPHPMPTLTNEGHDQLYAVPNHSLGGIDVTLTATVEPWAGRYSGSGYTFPFGLPAERQPSWDISSVSAFHAATALEVSANRRAWFNLSRAFNSMEHRDHHNRGIAYYKLTDPNVNLEWDGSGIFRHRLLAYATVPSARGFYYLVGGVGALLGGTVLGGGFTDFCGVDHSSSPSSV